MQWVKYAPDSSNSCNAIFSEINSKKLKIYLLLSRFMHAFLLVEAYRLLEENEISILKRKRKKVKKKHIHQSNKKYKIYI